MTLIVQNCYYHSKFRISVKEICVNSEKALFSMSELKNNVSSHVPDNMNSELEVETTKPLVEEPIFQLPNTVTYIEGTDGTKIYVVGTAHFSEESQNDVIKTIQNMKPNIVMVELCSSRAHILQFDKEALLEEASTITVKRIQAICKQNGLFNGLMYIMLLKTIASITKQLNMAPGGEFRVAFIEASKIPKCVFQLGDRPLSITIQRALGALSWWRTIKLLWSLLVHPTSISKKEVEDYKNSDFLEKMLLELSKEYPELGRVFIHERDKFLAYSLQVATRHYPSVERPLLVVGVVGLGHISGIVKHFGKVTAEEIRELLRVPEPSKSSIIIQKGFKYTAVVACVYFSFKMLPMSVKTGIFEMTQKILPSK